MEIKSIRASIVYEYSPEEYLAVCEEEEIKPTQEGFLSYIEDSIHDDIGYDALIEIIE